ncbi:hypothetical protein Q8A67_002053 [Cirrhinus molitorella]|uniref:Uncharacterized protein n=1 Tax=Cirrhinus molitorella TaxID=172907 RepID=A0AA88QJP4_9TELE|nr:hypothetical protein Q8A67_002053 [Cirrhinus molitorella]
MIHETVFRHSLDPGSKIHDWLRSCGETGFSGGGSVSYCGRAAQTLVPDTGTSAKGNMADLRSERRGGRTGRGGGGSVRGYSRRQSVLAYCGIRGRNGDCRRGVTSCGRYRGDFEIEQMPGHRKRHLCA